MYLTKDGVTFDVKSPLDVARLKKAGYVESDEKPAEKKSTGKAEKTEKPAEKEKKGGE